MRFETYNLDQLAEIKYGKNQKKVIDEHGKIPIYGTGGLMGYANKALYDKPSVLIGRKGTIDKVRYVDQPFWTVDTLFYTKINDEVVIPKFFYYAVSMLDLIKLNEGTTIPSLRTETLNRLEFNIPSLNDQKRILSILDPIEQKISNNKVINKNLQAQCSLLYDSLCAGAEKGTLGDLLSVIETGSRPKGGAQADGIPSIGAEKIESFGVYDFSNEKYISEDFFSKLKRGKVMSGDVLLYKDGAYTGKSSMALDGFPHRICAINEHVFILRTENLFAQSFVYYTLQNDLIHQTIYSLACGKAAQPGLNQQELCSVEIPIPSKERIVAFETSVSPMMHQIALNAIQSRRLSELRDTLLPKLMSGEIDVSDLSI